MESIKGRGLDKELRPLMRRVGRAAALERITPVDHEYIVSRLKEVEARVVSMREFNRDGEEVG